MSPSGSLRRSIPSIIEIFKIGNIHIGYRQMLEQKTEGGGALFGIIENVAMSKI